MSLLEYATAADPARNYCLWDYAPPAPAEDKLRSVSLLLHSFAHADLDIRAHGLIDTLRETVGPFRTVFGIKRRANAIAWEFYFYDYARAARTVDANAVLVALRPILRCEIAVRPNLPYFMFSLDLDGAIAGGERALDRVHVYVGNPGSAVSSGVAYALDGGGARLENFYFFFDAATELPALAKKIASSPHFDPDILAVEDVLLPQLRQCRTICLANKQDCDCVYFSGIGVDAFLWFLRRFSYPAASVEFVALHRHALDHLLFDVGFDFRTGPSGLMIIKSGYYGVF